MTDTITSLDYGVFNPGDSKPVALFREKHDAWNFVLWRTFGDVYYRDVDTDGATIWEQAELEDEDEE